MTTGDKVLLFIIFIHSSYSTRLRPPRVQVYFSYVLHLKSLTDLKIIWDNDVTNCQITSSGKLRRSVSYTIRVDTHDVTCCLFVCTHGTHVAEIECKLTHTRRILSQFHVVAAAFARALQKMRHRKLARSFCPCFVMNKFEAAEFHMQPLRGQHFPFFSQNRAWNRRKTVAASSPRFLTPQHFP